YTDRSRGVTVALVSMRRHGRLVQQGADQGATSWPIHDDSSRRPVASVNLAARAGRIERNVGRIGRVRAALDKAGRARRYWRAFCRGTSSGDPVVPAPATVLENKIDQTSVGYHLLVMGPDLFATHPLPPRGVLTIGRAENAD